MKEIKIIKSVKNILLLYIMSMLSATLINAQSIWQSQILHYDSNKKLTYESDAEGNRIPDFSYAGYKNGEAEIPNVQVIRTIAPIAGDNTQHIQSAIDEVGAMPLDQNGIRGALLLTAGTYQIDGTIYINFDGVVLRGVGDEADSTSNTILYAKGDTPHQRSIIVAGGGSLTRWNDQIEGTQTNVTDSIIYVGSNSFTVENASMYSPGDNIIIYHPVTDKWIAALGGGGTDTDRDWLVSDGINIIFNRYIKNIDGNTITVDVPLYNTLNKTLSQSYIYKYARTDLKTNIGIENLRIDIEAEGVTTNQNGNEDHAWQAIDLFQIEDAWVTNCTMLHFGQSGVRFCTATRITVDSCKALEPISIVTGERRYNFNLYHASQQILVKNCLSTYARHDFISNGTSSTSGCVFYNNESRYAYASSEGHRLWTQGLLYDNITFTSPNTSTLLGLYSRGSYGTSHGWAAAHSVAWNCSVPNGNRIIIQKPPTAQNYAIGCSAGTVTGLKSQGAPFDYPEGYIEGSNQIGLFPSSLYHAQIEERLGTGTPPATPGNLEAAVVSSRKINLKWIDNSNNEIVFKIERSTDEGTTWSSLVSVGVNVTNYIDTMLTESTSYYYRIRAENFYGNSDYTDTASATTLQGLPIEVPTDLMTTNVTINQIDISWKDNSNNEDNFLIERAIGKDTTWVLLATTSIDVTEYSDTGLMDSTTYSYRVKAANFYGTSKYSNIVNATTQFKTEGNNLALNMPVTFSTEQLEGGSGENPASNAVDGDTNTRWSSARDSTWPQWLEVDLGSVKTINRTEVICFNDRAYQFTVDVRNDSNATFTNIVDRQENTTPGTVDSPIIDEFEHVEARYVRITVTGAYDYVGTWTSIIEFVVCNTSEPVGVKETYDIPADFRLFQNYPNPFNPSTIISYQVPVSGQVTLKVYDILGKEVATLVNEKKNTGSYQINFDATNITGGKVLSSGVYLYRMHVCSPERSGNFMQTRKMLLIK